MSRQKRPSAVHNVVRDAVGAVRNAVCGAVGGAMETVRAKMSGAVDGAIWDAVNDNNSTRSQA